MDMEPWRESATPSMSRYSEGGFIGWFSRPLRKDTSAIGESMMLMVMVQVQVYEIKRCICLRCITVIKQGRSGFK